MQVEGLRQLQASVAAREDPSGPGIVLRETGLCLGRAIFLILTACKSMSALNSSSWFAHCWE